MGAAAGAAAAGSGGAVAADAGGAVGAEDDPVDDGGFWVPVLAGAAEGAAAAPPELAVPISIAKFTVAVADGTNATEFDV